MSRPENCCGDCGWCPRSVREQCDIDRDDFSREEVKREDDHE